ncbi:MAG: phosphoribosylformylglycinamidine synthase subunit PurQ [Chitinivibrionales bacterium]|nr:phosphoribosylformylglycinamidine synthase subunit PurQ [Chitinivibrionales bacterium]
MAPLTSAIILAGNGTNCEMESAYACRLAGFDRVDIVSIWELLSGDVFLDYYDFLCLPGGFLDGDDLGSAKAQANRLQSARVQRTGLPLFDQIIRFIRDGKLILGICNGFQLMVKLGLLPGLDGSYFKQTVTLTNNDSGKFEDRWVSLAADPASPCIFTKGMSSLNLPVRHGEGKLVCRDSGVLAQLQDRGHIALRYCDPSTGLFAMKYPENPNGSQCSIAGLTDPTGRLCGLMPHPEAFLHRTNHPRWTRETLPEEGAGLQFFRNACAYIKDNK